MGSVPPLLSFLLMITAGWVHRHQLIVIELLQAENRLLKERLRGKRIRFTDAERALLARKAKAARRKALVLRQNWRCAFRSGSSPNHQTLGCTFLRESSRCNPPRLDSTRALGSTAE